MILGVFSQLLGAGGIPYAGREAAAVLASFSAEFGVPCGIVSLNDPKGRNQFSFEALTIPFFGSGGAKRRLGFKVMRALRKTTFAYFGHVGIASLGLPMRLRHDAKYMVAGHGVEVWQPVPPLARVALRRAAIVTAPSRFTADMIREKNGVAAERLVVLPWGLSPDFCRRAAREYRKHHGKGLEPRGPIVVTVARLDFSERYKGIDHMIEAIAHILPQFPKLTYVVVGDGSDRSRLQELAATLGIAARVMFTGPQSDDEVASWYAAADVYAMPSKGEGLGLSFIEAMASGKPVLAANVAAAPEVVIDGETGFLAAYGDVAGLARCLRILLENPDLRRRMGDAGRARFEKLYTFDAFRTRLGGLLASQMQPDLRHAVAPPENEVAVKTAMSSKSAAQLREQRYAGQRDSVVEK